jgi:hypothetical protein
MSSPLGNVPFKATFSQTPFVEIRTAGGVASGAIGVVCDVVVVAGAGAVGTEVDGLAGVDGAGVVFVAGVSPTPRGFEGLTAVELAGVAAGTTVAGAAGAAAAGVAATASCWTNGSLLPKRPKEINWSAFRWTTTRPVSGKSQPDDGAGATALDDVIAEVTDGAAL